MAQYNLKSVVGLSLEAMAEAFNAAYEGYIVPVHVDSAWVTGHLAGNSIDPANCWMAEEDNRIVGIGLLGLRDRRGWIGGVGIVPERRGQGVGRALMEALHATARAQDAESVQLEYIIGNEQAGYLYERLGYQRTRRLLVIGCDQLSVAIEPNAASPAEAVPVEQALAQYERLHRLPNPWQREKASLQNSANLTAWAVHESGPGKAITAYGIARVGERGVQILDLAFAPGATEALRQIVAAIHAPGLPVRLVNLGEDDPAWPVLADLGYRESLSQWEMQLRL